MSKNDETTVEQVFLIHGDGRLIAHASIRCDSAHDEELVSGMLTAVKDLLTVVFEKKEAKENMEPFRFEMGEMNVVLRMGRHFYMATVIRGEESKAISEKSEAAVQAIQDGYDDVLANWLGQMNDVDGVHDIITQVLPVERLSETERERLRDGKFFKKVRELWALLYEE
jgi:hypothetical protein